jgi:hypothetical protein
MGLFNRLFGTSEKKVEQPDVRFGRYSDSYKSSDNYRAWDEALEHFETEAFLESYKSFFRYLRDEREDNVRCWQQNEVVHFELYQGSKKICGTADAQHLRAEARIAHSNELNVNFMRQLIERNFDLSYSRFSLDDKNNITIVFDTFTLDGSPYKLYYALKEMAVNADKQDDLLLEEFKSLEQVENSHLTDLTDAEKEAKYHYFQQEIAGVLNEMEQGQLNREQYPGGIAYLLLDLTYRLDYLTKPEGYTMEVLERMHRLYFAKDNKTIAQKNKLLVKEFRKLAERPKADFFREMYRVKTTFGITAPVNHEQVASVIDGEINNMDWYRDNGYAKIAQAIPHYIVGFSIFNYALPKPDRDLFHLYFQITEQAYFQSLGFTLDFYDPIKNSFNRRAIRRAIEQIVEENEDKYEPVSPLYSILRYESMVDFSKSFLLMVRNLEVMKRD